MEIHRLKTHVHHTLPHQHTEDLRIFVAFPHWNGQQCNLFYSATGRQRFRLIYSSATLVPTSTLFQNPQITAEHTILVITWQSQKIRPLIWQFRIRHHQNCLEMAQQNVTRTTQFQIWQWIQQCQWRSNNASAVSLEASGTTPYTKRQWNWHRKSLHKMIWTFRNWSYQYLPTRLHSVTFHHCRNRKWPYVRLYRLAVSTELWHSALGS